MRQFEKALHIELAVRKVRVILSGNADEHLLEQGFAQDIRVAGRGNAQRQINLAGFQQLGAAVAVRETMQMQSNRWRSSTYMRDKSG
ncbi:hypothetical protein OY671_012676, partial [Metschnikowia pulcherrima]